ncbi:NUMOD4 motif-containing HNH endonuclease [Rhodococcus pyridinivorans]|uniref:NUMOD4 motif-containing HNH endonuclease n=1 Tax=Rhodococcus pyridinivorans TaxID=103816 RepID=UPI0039E7C849
MRGAATRETMPDLVKLVVAARWWNTLRPLTHPLDLSKGGLAVNASAEIWKPVVGYEGYYEVSNKGRVRSVSRIIRLSSGGTRTVASRTLKPFGSKYGHLALKLSRDGEVKNCRVHRMVLEAFVGPCPDGMEGCHNNGIADDNRLENLRWDTSSENKLDTVSHGRHAMAIKTHCRKGHEFTAENIYRRRNGGRTCKTCTLESSRRRYIHDGKTYNSRKTHCKRGHEFSSENTYVGSKGERVCRTCRRERHQPTRKGTGTKP